MVSRNQKFGTDLTSVEGAEAEVGTGSTGFGASIAFNVVVFLSSFFGGGAGSAGGVGVTGIHSFSARVI